MIMIPFFPSQFLLYLVLLSACRMFVFNFCNNTDVCLRTVQLHVADDSARSRFNASLPTTMTTTTTTHRPYSLQVYPATWKPQKIEAMQVDATHPGSGNCSSAPRGGLRTSSLAFVKSWLRRRRPLLRNTDNLKAIL